MMSLQSKRELLEVVRPRYLKAKKLEKQKMLDEFTSATGYHRKHAIRVLKSKVQVQNHLKGKTKTYKTIYCGEVVQVLEQIWEIYGQICSKRLQPILPEAIKVLERCQEIEFSKDTKELLLKISSASIDRCLRPVRCKSPHGLSTTKPGSLLKSLIPVQTFTAWDEERPGFMEIDLVAHCGNTTEGQYLNTLTCTDISTGWTDVTALAHRSQQIVSTAIHRMRQRLPFPLLGIDSDNGSEFINDLLYRYCLDEKITFTRSRPYQKNDQAHVEQKNWSVVCHTVGYDRWETDQELPSFGRPPKLNRADQLLMTLMYWREYRTQFHIAGSYGISEATVCRTINKVEDALVHSGKFHLPGKKVLQPSDTIIEVVLVDASEQPIERPKKSKNSTTAAKRSVTPRKHR